MPKMKRAWRNVLKRLWDAGKPLTQNRLPDGNGHCSVFRHASDKVVSDLKHAGFIEDAYDGLFVYYKLTAEGRALLEYPAHD